jgi:hypothetical protein
VVSAEPLTTEDRLRGVRQHTGIEPNSWHATFTYRAAELRTTYSIACARGARRFARRSGSAHNWTRWATPARADPDRPVVRSVVTTACPALMAELAVDLRSVSRFNMSLGVQGSGGRKTSSGWATSAPC